MHFEILVEDQSGKKMLDLLVPKIIGDEDSFNIHAYNGIGRIPRNLRESSDPSKRLLLDRLPSLLQGYGNTFSKYSPNYPAVVILVCDLDSKCMKAFREELCRILQSCNPRPETRFCIAIEEGEAWFLGDIPAVKKAYPRARDSVFRAYRNDSICGTWEKLADAVYPGGSQKLSTQGWQRVGAEKSRWAECITPNMDLENNNSSSFCYFRQKLRKLAGTD